MLTTLMAGILVSIICFYLCVIIYKYTLIMYWSATLAGIWLYWKFISLQHTIHYLQCVLLSLQVPDSGFNINFLFTYLYFMLLMQCGIIRDCAWYCINYTFCHVNITYCGLALESKLSGSLWIRSWIAF